MRKPKNYAKFGYIHIMAQIMFFHGRNITFYTNSHPNFKRPISSLVKNTLYLHFSVLLCCVLLVDRESAECTSREVGHKNSNGRQHYTTNSAKQRQFFVLRINLMQFYAKCKNKKCFYYHFTHFKRLYRCLKNYCPALIYMYLSVFYFK